MSLALFSPTDGGTCAPATADSIPEPLPIFWTAAAIATKALPRHVQARTRENRVAGLAFTGQGHPTDRTTDDDSQTRIHMLDSITPGTISVWACGGSGW